MNRSDRLEEEGRVEICAVCSSLNLQEVTLESKDVVWCGTCGTTDYTKEVDLKEYLIEKNNV